MPDPAAAQALGLLAQDMSRCWLDVRSISSACASASQQPAARTRAVAMPVLAMSTSPVNRSPNFVPGAPSWLMRTSMSIRCPAATSTAHPPRRPAPFSSWHRRAGRVPRRRAAPRPARASHGSAAATFALPDRRRQADPAGSGDARPQGGSKRSSPSSFGRRRGRLHALRDTRVDGLIHARFALTARRADPAGGDRQRSPIRDQRPGRWTCSCE